MAFKVNIESLDMEKHPKFEGVRIGFVTTKDTTPQLSITVLEVEEGVEIPVHTHEREVDTIFVVKGEGEVFLVDKWVPFKEGDIIVIPPGDSHGVKARNKLLCYIVHAPALW